MKHRSLSFFYGAFVVFLFFQSPAFSQEILDGFENDSRYLMEMDKGVELMNKGEFISADLQFKQVLSQVEIVPADLCFYFGKNSYHLKKYKQSIDWLNKYMELKGTSGQFFDQAVEYLELAKADFEAESTKKVINRNQENKTAQKKEMLDCETHPYVTCPVCKGTGVMVEEGKLGASIYKTCPYSDQHGRMTCEDYKLYVQGKLQPGSKE